MEEPVIIIGGGVGPMAGVALHAKIIEQTRTDGTDQAHCAVFHHSCSALIADRTAYLERPLGDNPGLAMAEVFARACRSLAPGQNESAVGGVPCNTFHAPRIYDAFAESVAKKKLPVRLVHMLRETTALIGRMLGKPEGGMGAGDGMGAGEKIGVLCTLGARKSGVYDRLLAANGYVALYPPHDEQAALHAAVYDREWGIKAVSPVSQKAADIVAARVERLASAGAACVILGCTELPLALPGMAHKGALLVDPVLALARALIREANPAKLKDLET